VLATGDPTLSDGQFQLIIYCVDGPTFNLVMRFLGHINGIDRML